MEAAIACDWRKFSHSAKGVPLIWGQAWAPELLLGQASATGHLQTRQRSSNGVIVTSNVRNKNGKVVGGGNKEHGVNKVHDQGVTG